MSFHRGLLGLAFVIGLLVCGTSGASAGFIFQSQTRSVYGRAWGGLGTDSETLTAPNFGVFDATTSVTVPTYGGSANQHQRSELLSNLIKVTGGTSISYPAMVGTGQAESQSLTDVTFTINQPMPVKLEASGTVTGPALVARTISLTGPSTNLNWNFFTTAGFPAKTGSNSTTLTLQPGSYQFVVRLGSYVSASPSDDVYIPNFAVQLSEVPEPMFIAPVLLGLLPLIRCRSRRNASPRVATWQG